jgi:hypothetical protein
MRQIIPIEILLGKDILKLSDGTEVSSLAKGSTLYIYVTPNPSVYGYCTAMFDADHQGFGYASNTAEVGDDSSVSMEKGCYM